ncbi:MAG: phosphatase [Candidatus Omnitrophica bacterium CG11_big_fil_rev_8_21_14_0_20_42_13]|uniref:Phosphatase n=1 Tax=Candidatus Ghiorseimicrobium undicola TaxID=1974746 RepID=A0A2H0LWR2_9BACT|nr:MAG: phosphatase [Candidatus Omnitrophica bacterium CG11_big_fil_rev_8_21_14_0_20_42_13]
MNSLESENRLKFADLHTHTVFSDGTDTPERIVKVAKSCGLSAIAICDHDTVDGVLPVTKEAGASGVEIVPSLELSAEGNNIEVHILGFFIDYNNGYLIDKLAEIRQDRVVRMLEMVKKLNSLNIPIEADKVFEIAGAATVGRMHLARALHSQGYVSSFYEAFDKYIGENCPAYVSRFKLDPKGAIELILEAKGVPVLAHPHTLNNDDLIGDFSLFGLGGLEVYYPEYSPSAIEHYRAIADKFGLIKTGGSDYHGSIKPQNPLGKVKVPYSTVEQLKDAKPS